MKYLTLWILLLTVALGGGSVSAQTANGSIAAGLNHGLALKYDSNKLFSWGSNTSGQLGVGNKNATTQIQTVQASAGVDFTGVMMISAGNAHSLALTNAGAVYAWGEGANGQLGTTGTNDKTYPALSKLSTGAALPAMQAIASGKWHNLALTTSGAVYAFGRNNNGQIGVGDNTDRLGAVQVKTNSTTKLSDLVSVQAIGCGYTHSLAVATTGALYAWGDNSHLELGLTGTTDRLYVKEITSVTGAASAAGGSAFSVILLNSGNLVSLGKNDFGQLGNKVVDGADQSSPQTVKDEVASAALHDIVQVACGADFALALTSAGQVYAWGSNHTCPK